MCSNIKKRKDRSGDPTGTVFPFSLGANEQDHPQLLQEKKARSTLSTGIGKTW